MSGNKPKCFMWHLVYQLTDMHISASTSLCSHRWHCAGLPVLGDKRPTKSDAKY